MRTTLALITAGLLASAGCKHKDSTAGTALPPGTSTAGSGSAAATMHHAVAKLAGTKGHEGVTGTILFDEVAGGGVKVTAHVEGLTPGDHGFHIHEKGDCSAPDGTSAGGHFNPSNHKHGAPDASEHHEGDLGNLTADASGKAEKTLTLSDVTVGSGAGNDVVGKGFILHDKADDFTTQPTGNAGARVACGVITAQ